MNSYALGRLWGPDLLLCGRHCRGIELLRARKPPGWRLNPILTRDFTIWTCQKHSLMAVQAPGSTHQQYCGQMQLMMAAIGTAF